MSRKLVSLFIFALTSATSAGLCATGRAADRARPLTKSAPATTEESDSLSQDSLEGLADAAPVMSAGGIEVVRERYPDGKVKIERQVVLDDTGNYVNHGEWKLLAPNGDTIAQGNFDMGKRTGPWMRWHSPKDTALLGEFPFKHFKPPF